MKKFNLLTVVLSMLICGCTAQKKSGAVPTGSVPETSGQPMEYPAIEDGFSSSQIGLYLNLTNGIVGEHEGENVLVSPLSVQMILAMVANGAEGDTLTSLLDSLGGYSELTSMNGALGEYIKSITESDSITLSVSNSIWHDGTMPLSESFKKACADSYGADIMPVTFGNDTQSAVNLWVKEKTGGMIDEFAPIGSPVSALNAVCLDAEWEVPFEGTIRSRFHSHPSDNGCEDCDIVDFMGGKEHKYIETMQGKGFIKDYKGGNLSFAAILPNDGITAERLLSELTAEELYYALANYTDADVKVYMPIFDVSFTDESINGELKAAGVLPDGELDLSGILDGETECPMNDALSHVTRISVDTHGTKAAAVSGFTYGGGRPKIEVTLNRPFVYMIIDNTTNIPIFIGILNTVQ